MQACELIDISTKESRCDTIHGSAYMKSLGQTGDCTSDLRQHKHNSTYFEFMCPRPTTKHAPVIINIERVR